jgi:hypothetical protein
MLFMQTEVCSHKNSSKPRIDIYTYLSDVFLIQEDFKQGVGVMVIVLQIYWEYTMKNVK